MRQPHKIAHPECPHANWAACDAAAKVQWGQCKAMVDDKEPHPCSRWAVSEDGWCGQHYASETERISKAERIAIARAAMEERIDSYIRAQGQEPHVCDGIDCSFSHRAPSHVCDPGCPWSPEAIAAGEERRRQMAEAEKMMAGGAGLEPAVTRVTAEGPTTERPAKVRFARVE